MDRPDVEWRALTATTVSRVRASHSGPYQWVHLASTLIDESNPDALAE